LYFLVVRILRYGITAVRWILSGPGPNFWSFVDAGRYGKPRSWSW
jgi:hypothetical protein